MTIGLVIGKFYPPTTGHSFLIDTALQQVDHLVVIVCDKEGQTIAGTLRAKWLRQMHPTAEVIVVPDILDPDDSQAWAKYTIAILGYVPDLVFTSEDYGPEYARWMGTQHVMVDKDRVNVPCSARYIRQDPLTNWHFLHPVVRQYYLKRICLVGAESTGTTTLTQALARAYKTVWVPEYGRIYAEGKVYLPNYGAWHSQEFTHIGQSQIELEQQLAPHAQKFLFMDTDAFATKVWHLRYMGYSSEELEKLTLEHQTPDLYIVTSPDIPFVQDGSRDGQHIRHWMHDLFLIALSNAGLHFVVVNGKHERRLLDAVAAVSQLPPGR